MRWSVTRSTDSVHVEILTLNGYNHCGSPRAILGMHSGGIEQELFVGENPAMAQTLLNQFIKVQANYPARDFRAPGWVHPTQKPWWRDLALYVLEYFKAELMKIGLHETVRATCHGIEITVPNFFTIFELYCPASRTFPVDELGLALHEMWEISNLPMSSMPYEEYFPYTMELE